MLEAPIQRQVLAYKVFSDAPLAHPGLVKDEEATLQDYLKTIRMRKVEAALDAAASGPATEGAQTGVTRAEWRS